jgi:hypothetical protein
MVNTLLTSASQIITSNNNVAGDALNNLLNINSGQLSSTLNDINSKNQAIIDRQTRQAEQLNEISEKEKLILTRSRMLQISQDRNAYKKKIIYSLIALILFIFIATIMIYVLFKRKAGLSNMTK